MTGHYISVERSLKSNFDKSFDLIIAKEGGWVNNPADPGGETIWGVTKRVWESYTGKPIDSMKGLTQQDVKPLYKKMYWDAIRGDELPNGLDYCVFDCAVNSGVFRAVKILQSCIGVNSDGAIGNNTMAAVSQFKDPKQLIKDYTKSRLSFVEGLKNFSIFGEGWESRIEFVRDKALSMI